MKSILLIKTSSLGDVIHTLPALTDLQRAYPGIKVDWVVESAFAEIPTWHPAVARVIPVNIRRWRKNIWATSVRQEFRAFCQQLTQQHYDAVIDAQGLLKSAFLTVLARGNTKMGYDKQSAREPLSALFYRRKIAISKQQHAIHRIRQLFATAFNYVLPTEPLDYGLRKEQFQFPQQVAMDHSYLVFLHGTTWDSKHWPETHWLELARLATTAGFHIMLSYGNDAEFARAERIQCVAPAAICVLPRLQLSGLLAVLGHAAGVVSVDTGLGHLAAALAVPVISLYGPTNPQLTGMLGRQTEVMASHYPCAPCMQKQCHLPQTTSVYPPCFEEIAPARVWQALQAKLVS
jgi:heptosyltransferase-1